ncbi:MAG TPA: alpha/beta hydrolase [Flavobacteriales bacterium]|nr:alpha/beta hydrolase [Flavobacteriales bacterium]HHZ95701.1 alpha/beta hydrolase [Flavobacteriales bacterium]HIB76493.1 alpha/beta hydrolase [Flavobacteriales bacterium]HIO58747.1 alpha/beta hydrolase [Flavobacteriales bacterium]
MRNFYSIIFVMLFMSTMNAQVRYMDEIFADVTVTSNVQYAANVTVITTLQGLPPMALPQLMDVYEPTGDVATNRPLIVYLHTGNFLPQYLNGGATGNKDDFAAVEICSRFARMGYVVASIDYRLGWNPLAATQSERTNQLINAAYRGVQDARTAVRYFRMDADVQGNAFGIDPLKVGYFGEGTGGYVSLAAATISDYNDIIIDDLGNPIAKFWYDPGDGSSIPMVIEGVHGDPEAKNDGFTPDGLQLCIGHYPTYSSDVNFSMNMGGALGDLNWLESGDVPMVSFQCPHDPFAPYTTGVLIVPTTGNLIVEVSGAYDVHAEINAQVAPNNNDVFQSAALSDPLSLESAANGGFDGLFPVLNDYVGGVPTQPYDGSPWQWWDEAAAQAYDAANGTAVWATQMTLNPNMGPTEANYWIDIIQGYTAPRLALAMGVVAAGPGCTDTAACNFNALATSDDGSCTYAAPGYDCNGVSLNIEGCTDALACNFDETATIDNGTCDYHVGTDIPTGATEVWLVGLTLTGTPYEPLAGGCEAAGGVNPNVSINGVIVGDGATPLSMAGINDPTGLLGELAALATTVQFSICGTGMTVAALGNNIPMIGNGQFWISPIPVNADGQYLWAGPMLNFTLGCGDPSACNFSGNPCELSVACAYPGCTDATADNYDPTAGCDDGSCVTLGCTDPTAFNYNAAADTDDGSCVAVVNGCTDIDASNYDATANTEDGSCIFLGCTYAAADNYDSLANDDDGSCTFTTGSGCVGDLDGDGVSATSDLLLFLSVFGSTCN